MADISFTKRPYSKRILPDTVIPTKLQLAFSHQYTIQDHLS